MQVGRVAQRAQGHGVHAAEAHRDAELARAAGAIPIGTSRKADSFAGIRQQVARWSAQQGTSWDPGDVENITVYLNDLYYKLPCPTEVCSAKLSSLTPRQASGLARPGAAR